MIFLREEISLSRKQRVGSGERFVRADVEPIAGDYPRVDGVLGVEPLDEAAGLVGVVAFFYVAADFGQHRSRVIIEGDADESALGFIRFFFKTDEPAGFVHGNDAVFFGFFQRTDIVQAEHRGLGFAAAIAEAAQVAGEKIVASDHQQIVIDGFAFDDVLQIADGTEAVFVGAGAVVDDGAVEIGLCFLVFREPVFKVAGKLFVGDDKCVVNASDGCAAGEDVFDHRLVADGQQGFGGVLGERVQPCGVAGGEDDSLHSTV